MRTCSSRRRRPRRSARHRRSARRRCASPECSSRRRSRTRTKTSDGQTPHDLSRQCMIDIPSRSPPASYATIPGRRIAFTPTPCILPSPYPLSPLPLPQSPSSPFTFTPIHNRHAVGLLPVPVRFSRVYCPAAVYSCYRPPSRCSPFIPHLPTHVTVAYDSPQSQSPSEEYEERNNVSYTHPHRSSSTSNSERVGFGSGHPVRSGRGRGRRLQASSCPRRTSAGSRPLPPHCARVDRPIVVGRRTMGSCRRWLLGCACPSVGEAHERNPTGSGGGGCPVPFHSFVCRDARDDSTD